MHLNLSEVFKRKQWGKQQLLSLNLEILQTIHQTSGDFRVYYHIVKFFMSIHESTDRTKKH